MPFCPKPKRAGGRECAFCPKTCTSHFRGCLALKSSERPTLIFYPRSHLQPSGPAFTISSVKLQQRQIWNQGDLYLLILHLERLEVQYKSFKNLATRKGPHHHVSKKEFCRLIKHATLLSPEEIQKARTQ